MATGAFFAGAWGVDQAQEMWNREAQAAQISAQGWGGPIEPVAPVGSIESQPLGTLGPTFFGVADRALLAPLRGALIDRAKFNRGGSSISLRVDFEGGGRAAFKPDQTNTQTVPRHEVAAYRIDRLLGLGAVPPAVAVRYRMSDIVDHLDSRNLGLIPRLRAEVIEDDGWVDGELSWWIPEIEHARVGGFPVDSTDGIVTWKRLLSAGKPIPAEDLAMAAQISNMVLFDHLINNSDRWTGNNTCSSPDNRWLYFMDNAMSFGPDPDGHERTIIYLKRSQKFSRRLVARLRALDLASVRAAVADDRGPYDYLLDDVEIAAVLHRRDYALAYIDELVAEYGAENVLVFP